jgi:hypothetical protein
MREGGEDHEVVSDDDVICVSALQYMCVTRGVMKTVFAPLDRIKFILQSQAELHRANRLDYRFSRGSECFRHLVAMEGWRSLYRGNTVQVLGLLPTALAQAFIGIPTSRFVFDVLPHTTQTTFAIASFSSGLAGAFTASLVSYPIDLVRFRLAMDMKPFMGASYEYRNALEVISHPHIADQPNRAYRGLGLYLLGSMLYRGFYLSSWQVVQPFLLTEDRMDEDEGPRRPWHMSHRSRVIASQAAVGYITMMLITLWLYPLDTVRRRYMMTVNNPDLEYGSVSQCARYIMRTEGAPGFFRGVGFTMMRGVITSAAAMVIGVNV